MKRKLFIATLLVFALFSCSKKPNPTGNDQPKPVDPVEENGPTAAQLEELSTFIQEAIATDDYCSLLESTEESFTVKTFKGKEYSMPARFDVVEEDFDASSLKNYVVNGKRFAEFNISGDVFNMPSDVKQWFNPSVPVNAASLKILFIGDEYLEDAVELFKDIIDSTGVTSVVAARAIAEGKPLADFATQFDVSSWCKYGEHVSGSQEPWPIIIGDGNSSVKEAVSAKPWDVIVITESLFASSGIGYEAVAPCIDAMLSCIFNECRDKRPAVLFMLPQALPSDNEYVVEKFEGSQMKMFEALIDLGKNIIEKTPIYDIVSVAAAIQNLRTSSIAYSSKNDITRDGARIDCGVGCYTTAGLIYCKLVEKSLAGATPFMENPALYSFSSSTEGEPVCTAVDETNVIYCRYAASKAATYPLQISDLSSLTPTVDSGEIPGVGEEEYPDIL